MSLIALRFQSGVDLKKKLFETWDQGDCVLPIDPRLPQEAAENMLLLLKPDRLVEDSGSIQLSDGAPIDREAALVVATSGVSGPAKGVQLSHSALEFSAEASRQKLGYFDNETWLCCLPLSHIAGLMVLVRAHHFGAKAIIHDRFDVELVRSEKKASLISLVPTMLARLLDAGADLSGYSLILLGGGPIPEGLLERCLAKQLPVVTTYGMTETCGGCVYDGVPFEGAELSISAEQQVLIRGPMLMQGYRMQPELTSASVVNGWFRTGDRGRILEDNRLEITGRMDDLIITAGRNVSPSEVEQILTEHPSVAEAAVVGLPDPDRGQIVAAVVVPSQGMSTDIAELKEFIASKTARYKAPRRIVTSRAIPRTSLGKPIVEKCRELLIRGT